MMMQEDVNPSTQPLETIYTKLGNWWDAFIENLPNIGIALIVMVIAYFIV